MKRFFDILLAGSASIVLLLPMMCIAILVRLTSKGPAIYWSDRVGKRNRIFSMPKFRTMHANTPAIATHLLSNPELYLTPIGGFLRKTSLDELPQLWCVLTGDMSLVGPRPALFNQADLIGMRTKNGIDALNPGLTGWAQVNGRDELPIAAKVEYDLEYRQRMSFWLDIKILWMTVFRVIGRDGIKH